MAPIHPFPPHIRSHIIPAILAHSKKEFVAKLGIIKKHYPHNRIQIDVLDGKFVPYTAWCGQREISFMRMRHFDVHLMTLHPERKIRMWRAAGADRVFFHIEAAPDPMKVIREIKKWRMRAGIALNPETPLEKVRLLLPHLDAILLMGEHPGYGGQPFQKKVVTKIKKARMMAPELPIVIDGGVTPRSAALLIKAGATELASGHAALSAFLKKTFDKK